MVSPTFPPDSPAAMDSAPYLFINAVCHQLEKNRLLKLKRLSGTWVKRAGEHYEKRREFCFSCCPWADNDRNEGYSLSEDLNASSLLVGDLNPCYDRIIDVHCSPESSRRIRVSMDELQRVVLPMIASLATNCIWRYLHLSAHNAEFFNAFKNSPGFNVLCVRDESQQSRDFVTRQLEMGNVEVLHFCKREDSFYLHNCEQRIQHRKPIPWSEPQKLVETIRTFVSSPRFHVLVVDAAPLPCDFDLFALFLERALAGELKPLALFDFTNVSFDERRLCALRPDCREDSEDSVAWRIPHSNERVVLSRGGRYMTVVTRLESEIDLI